MRITLNGTTTPVSGPTTIADLVGARRGIAVALNGEVLPRDGYRRLLSEGDEVEIVTAVQGG